MDTLSRLLHRTLDGDLDAFGEVVGRFQDMAFGCAYSVLGNFQDAEDATQDAFITAYTRLADLRDLKCFPGWLRRLVLTACNRITRKAEWPAIALEEAEAVPSFDGDPVRCAEDREMRDTIFAAIRSLPPVNRMATTLFYINGYSINEVAEFLEVPAGTVKYRLHESREQLKERMVEMVKDELVATKPTAELKERVLTEVGLGFPPGVITESVNGKTGPITFFLSSPSAATRPGPGGLIGLTFDRVTAATIVPGPLRNKTITEAGKPRCELLDIMCDLLRKSGVAFERVVLDAARGGQASALAISRSNGSSQETRMPASVALALAYRMRAKLLATPRLMRRGVAGEGVPPALDRKAIGELKRDILKYRVRDELLNLAWENGLDPDAGSRTVRYRISEREGTIGIFVSKHKRPVAVVDFVKYRDGVEQFRQDAALKCLFARLFRWDKTYRLSVQDRGNEIRCVVTRVRDG